jgi:hypothetical protein
MQPSANSTVEPTLQPVGQTSTSSSSSSNAESALSGKSNGAIAGIFIAIIAGAFVIGFGAGVAWKGYARPADGAESYKRSNSSNPTSNPLKEERDSSGGGPDSNGVQMQGRSLLVATSQYKSNVHVKSKPNVNMKT